MTSVKIGRAIVGAGRPCFIIAEAGSNHDGKFSAALELIDVAARAGADAVKFQTFRARTLYPRNEARPRYLRKLGVTKTIFQTIADMEMPFEWIPKLVAHCRKRKILFLSTPFDEECADKLSPFLPAFKIASYELTHVPLLKHLARTKKPLILSTGGATVPEIDRVLSHLRGAPVCLMQCTAKYPAPPDSLNLRVIPALKKRYGVPVGLSDHSLDAVAAPVAAVALGADILEKHFTLSRKMKGPDHSYAVEPSELAALVASVRMASAMLGDGRKRPHAAEAELRDYRRGLFTTRALGQGEAFTRANTAVLRRAGKPETDLPPERLDEVLGASARRSLPAFRLLSESAVVL
ncbi:MAG: N-acetylneuraminate synthase family protein [Elusimicrobia bacterium]|nr:N-acetylneuraminate synthase family protein [Elusimicrobiota bacterium]